MNQDLRNVLITVVTRAVRPTLLLVAAVSFITMPDRLGHHPGEAAAARHMT